MIGSLKRIAHLLLSISLLVFNAGSVHAVGEKPNALAVLERQVVTISASSSDGLRISVPLSALTLRNGTPGVFVLENNEARFRMVRLGKTGKSQVDILSGLFGDETLVLGELDKVHDGSPITILTKKAAVKK